MSDGDNRVRLDKWLWHARFFKTRSLATREVQAGHCRVNTERTHKASARIAAGDVLTFRQGDRIRVVRVLAQAERRGPATEAQVLYEDLTPPAVPVLAAPAYDGGGRPTKKDRRSLELSRRPPLE